MKTATYFLAVGTFLVAPSLSATQSAIVSGIQASAGELSPEVQLSIGLGDELTGHLRYDAAGRVGGWRRHTTTMATWLAPPLRWINSQLKPHEWVISRWKRCRSTTRPG